MADGPYRFHPNGGGPYYNRNHNHNRVTSPHGPRRNFPTDTPSPSRSPSNAAMVHNFGVYGHNGYQNQHMNGGQNHQRFNGMHMPKQNGNNHYIHHNQHQHSNHHANQISHAHNLSANAFQSQTPNLSNYAQDRLTNGNHDLNEVDDAENNDYWKEQLRIYEECSDSREGHHRARSYAQQSKALTFGGPLGASEHESVEERVRAATTSNPTYPNQSWTELDFGGQGLRSLSNALTRYSFLTRLDVPHNELFYLPPSIGQLRNLEYLDVSFNKLRKLPEEIGMLSNLRTLLMCGNEELVELPPELGYLYKLETIAIYGLQMSDEQKAAFLSEGTKGLISHLLETIPDLPPPEPRPWLSLDETAANEPDADIFRAANYNILCPRYCTKQKYGYVPQKHLDKEYRQNLVLDELKLFEADVICLQELDRISYDEFFRSQLASLGYKAHYYQKSRSETVGEHAKTVDGCGTFWRDNKYVLLETASIVLGRKAVERSGTKASADMLNRVWQRDDIATVVLLENRKTGSRLIVANSHTYWDPAFKDVKLIQVAVLMEELNRLSEKWAKLGATPIAQKRVFRFSNDDTEHDEPGPSLDYSSGNQIPTLVCGDFNSAPGSPVYDLFTKRVLVPHHEDFKGRDYGTLSTNGMSHSFTLRSTNNLVEGPYITNYTPEFVDELDHIFFSSNTLRAISVLGQVDAEYLKKVPGFPNQHFPSDHLALLSEFKVEKQRTGNVAAKADTSAEAGSRRH